MQILKLIFYCSVFVLFISFSYAEDMGTLTILGKEIVIKEKKPIEEIIPSKEEVSDEMISFSSVSLFPDLAETLKTLPGVVSIGDFSGLLYLRGTYPMDTRFSLDDVIIVWPYRWGGMLTLFNTNLIKKVDFYSGGYPAKASQALGGIIEVYYKEGSTEKNKGVLELSPATFALLTEGPIKKDKSSYLFSVSRTHYDMLMKWFGGKRNVAYPFYYDACLKLYSKPTYKDKISFLILHVGEGMDIDIKDLEESMKDKKGHFDYNYTNDIFAITHNHTFSPHLNNKLIFSHLIYNGDFDFFSTSDFFWKEKFEIEDTMLKNELTLKKGSHELKFGTFMCYGKSDDTYSYKFKQIEGTTTLVEKWYEEKYHWDRTSKYIGTSIWDRWELPSKIILDTGLMYESLNLSKQNLVSPRFSICIPAFGGKTKFSTGVYLQYPLFISAEGTEGVEDWANKLSKLSAEESNQYILGYEKNLRNDLRIKVETYHNKLDKLVLDDIQEGIKNKGRGNSQGFELFLQKKENDTKLDGWISYSFNKSRREVGISKYEQSKGTTKQENKLYPITQERPHVASLILNYKLPKRWKGNLKCMYASGAPYTPIKGVISYGGTPTTLYKPIEGEYLSARLPAYFKIDLLLKRDFKFHKLDGEYYMQLLNLTNHKNVDRYYYSDDYQERKNIYMFGFMALGGVKIKW